MRFDPQTSRAVAIAIAIGLVIIAAFQVALALGVPWGNAAYGGARATLPPELRVASAVAFVVWLLAAAVVLARAGYWGSARWSAAFGWGTWLVAGLLALGAVVNFASSSPWERFGWGPFALLFPIGCAVLRIRGGAQVTAAGSVRSLLLDADGGATASIEDLSARIATNSIEGGATATLPASDEVTGTAAGDPPEVGMGRWRPE